MYQQARAFMQRPAAEAVVRASRRKLILDAAGNVLAVSSNQETSRQCGRAPQLVEA